MLRRTALCLAALLLTGCGGSEPESPDVMFLQMMVPHHGQGVRIAQLARDRAVRPEVRTLAAAIETTQVSEIKSMAARLRAWRRPPTAPAGSHGAHGGMPVTPETLITKLAKTKGPTFERDFLNMLIAHQDDAVQMARREVATGTDPDTKALAERFTRSRPAQINQMLALLRAPTPRASGQ